MDCASLQARENTLATHTLGTHATIRELEDAAISRSDAELATKADLKAGITDLKAGITDLKAEIANLKAEIANLKSEVFRALWIQGAGLVGIQLAIAGLLFAAIRFFD